MGEARPAWRSRVWPLEAPGNRRPREMTVSPGIPRETGPGLQALSGAIFIFHTFSLQKLLGPPGGVQNHLNGSTPFQPPNRLPLPCSTHARVYLRGGHGLMPQEFLDDEQIHLKLMQTRGVRVAE